MEFIKETTLRDPIFNDQKGGVNDVTEPENSSSSLRMQYLAEKKVIIRKIGDLEDVRNELGLSKRKMCQLLMVDPSAWTRWLKQGSAPPAIYRSLQWYMALIDKQPEWHPQNSFNRAFDIKNNQLKNHVDVLNQRVKDMENSNRAYRKRVYMLFGCLALMLVAGMFIF